MVADRFQPYDFMSCFESVYQAAQHGSYISEYSFSLDLQQCFARAQDQHFGYILDIGGGLISFGRSNLLVSASPDGNSPQEVYMWNEIDAIVNHGANFKPSPIVKVNGNDTAKVMLEASHGAPIQDPDAAFNYLFANLLAPPGLWTYGFPTAGKYPGATTTYEFANGTILVDETVAFFSSPFGQNTTVQTGEDFYQAYLAISSDCDASGIGSVSVYEYARCTIQFANSTSTGPSSNSTDSTSTAQTTSLGNETTGSSVAPPGFPTPVSILEGTEAWGFFLDKKDVAVLAFASFSAKDSTPINSESLATFLEDFFHQAKAAGRTKLIIDMSNNLGGFEFSAFQLFHALFPSIDLVYGGNAQATDSLNLLGMEYSSTISNKTHQDFQYMDAYSSFNYRVDANLDNQNFTSWPDKFGPPTKGPDGTEFTPYWRFVTEYLSLNMESPFTPENTVLFSDGICGSSCATFAELAILQAGIRTAAIGGRPSADAMQIVGATRSFITSDWLSAFRNVASVFIEGTLHTPEYYNNTVLGDFNTLPIIRSNMNGLPLQLAQDPTDATMTPMMYKYQPADFQIPYTFQNSMLMELRWKNVADKIF
jgi:hypothetical protein